MAGIQQFLPFSVANRSDIAKFLGDQRDLRFMQQLDHTDHISLVSLFLGGTTLSESLLCGPGVLLLIQSFVARLRENGPLSVVYIKCLQQLNETAVEQIVLVSPPTVLNALFSILVNSGKRHNAAVRILNRNPRVFTSLILEALKDGVELSLIHIVSSPTVFTILARKLPTDAFLMHFDKSVDSMLPILGMDAYGKGVNPKEALFIVAGETLLLSAARHGKLDYLCTHGPPELKGVLPEAIASVCARLNPVPSEMVPYIAALALRTGITIFSRLNDGWALMCTIKIFIDENPDRAADIASFMCMTFHVWSSFMAYLETMPILCVALGRHVCSIVDSTSSGMIEILKFASITNWTAVNCVHRLCKHLPGCLDVLCTVARQGDIAFRAACVVAYDQGSQLWSDFCATFSAELDYVKLLLLVTRNCMQCGAVDRCLDMLYHICVRCVHESNGMKEEVTKFVFWAMTSVTLHERRQLIVLVKILLEVHVHAYLVKPIIGDIVDNLPERMLDLVIRYLWTSWLDPSPTFVVFRLRLLRKRIANGNPPRFWTDEMLKLT